MLSKPFGAAPAERTDSFQHIAEFSIRSNSLAIFFDLFVAADNEFLKPLRTSNEKSSLIAALSRNDHE
jgi:hypothetical protein